MTDQHQRPRASVRYGLCVALGLLITLTSGIVYGRLSQRWGPAPDLVGAGQYLQTFPTRLGGWELVEEKPIGETALRMLDCAGYIHRDYVDRNSGQTISMFVVVGPPGPIAVHTPEICYSSRAFSLQDARLKVTLRDPEAIAQTFWSTRFRSDNVLADQTLSVYYAWNDGTGWTASDAPRFAYGGRQMLYKIQLAGLVDGDPETETASPCYQFLAELLKSNWKVKNR